MLASTHLSSTLHACAPEFRGADTTFPRVKIRERYHRSRLNLVRLIGKVTELRVYDNSEEADPHTGALPEPILIVHLDKGKVVNSCDLTACPEWTKPILLVALKSSK